MMLRAYAGQPVQYAPDPGEIIYARRGEHDKFTLAVTEKVWRNRAGFVRVRVMWLEEDPDASPGERDRNDREDYGRRTDPPRAVRPVAPYEVGWLTLRHPLGETPLVKQVDKDQLPRTVIRKLSS